MEIISQPRQVQGLWISTKSLGASLEKEDTMTGGPLAQLNAAYRALERAQKGLEKAELSKKAELEARVKGRVSRVTRSCPRTWSASE